MCVCRDGMIKRPGNEDYLAKVMEEERQLYLKVLDVEGKGAGAEEVPSDEDSDNDCGLVMPSIGGSGHLHDD